MTGKIVMLDYRGFGEIRPSDGRERIPFDAEQLKIRLQDALGAKVSFTLWKGTALDVRAYS